MRIFEILGTRVLRKRRILEFKEDNYYGAWYNTETKHVDYVPKDYGRKLSGHQGWLLNNYKLYGIDNLDPEWSLDDLYSFAFNNHWVRIVFPTNDQVLGIEGSEQDVKKTILRSRKYIEGKIKGNGLDMVIVTLQPSEENRVFNVLDPLERRSMYTWAHNKELAKEPAEV